MESTAVIGAGHTLDLVTELRVERGWTAEFATKAHFEYLRWLRLRIHCEDLLYCELPPSSVIADVWELHRQYTLDYNNVCERLGGYVHHFPPAMMKPARDFAYVVTVQKYKAFYGEDPPRSHWDDAMKFNEASLTYIAGEAARDQLSAEPPERSLPSLRSSPAKPEAFMPDAW